MDAITHFRTIEELTRMLDREKTLFRDMFERRKSLAYRTEFALEVVDYHIFLSLDMLRSNEETSFLIPTDIEDRLRIGSMERYNAQLSKFRHLHCEQLALQSLIDLINKAVRRHMGSKKLQDSVCCRQILLYQFPVSEIHHMIVDHQDVIDRESRNHIDCHVRITAVNQTIRTKCPGEIIDGFAGQPVIHGYGIGIQNLGAGVHRILQLLIERTVGIGFLHASAKGAQTDIPDTGKAFIGSGDFCLHRQRVSGFLSLK